MVCYGIFWSGQFITWEWLRTLYEVLQAVQTKIRCYDCNGKIIFVSDEIHAKMPWTGRLL